MSLCALAHYDIIHDDRATLICRRLSASIRSFRRRSSPPTLPTGRLQGLSVGTDSGTKSRKANAATPPGCPPQHFPAATRQARTIVASVSLTSRGRRGSQGMQRPGAAAVRGLAPGDADAVPQGKRRQAGAAGGSTCSVWGVGGGGPPVFAHREPWRVFAVGVPGAAAGTGPPFACTCGCDAVPHWKPPAPAPL